MPRLALSLALLALSTACDGTTDPGTSPQTTGPQFVATSQSVDPGALTPAPPPETQPECRVDGQYIICRNSSVTESLNQPVVDIPEVPCGTLYETSRDGRLGTRWYAAADSVIVKRHVREEIEGTWSLSPDGAGPTVLVNGNGNWYDSQYADPTDLDSGVRFSHGELRIQAPGYGVIAHLAGPELPDGTLHGTFRFLNDPAVAAKLCAALTR